MLFLRRHKSIKSVKINKNQLYGGENVHKSKNPIVSEPSR